MSDLAITPAAKSKGPEKQDDKDRANSRKIQGALDQLNEGKSDKLNSDDKEKAQRDFLSVLTSQGDSNKNHKGVIDSFAKQTKQNKADRDQNVQTSAQGFLSEAPKLI